MFYILITYATFCVVLIFFIFRYLFEILNKKGQNKNKEGRDTSSAMSEESGPGASKVRVVLLFIYLRSLDFKFISWRL